MADLIDISKTSYNSLENGALPSAETLVAISKKLNCSTDYLLGRPYATISCDKEITVADAARDLVKLVDSGCVEYDESDGGKLIIKDAELATFAKDFLTQAQANKEQSAQNEMFDKMLKVWVQKRIEELEKIKLNNDIDNSETK